MNEREWLLEIDRMRRTGLAWWELLVGIGLIAIILIVTMPRFIRLQEIQRWTTCQDHLKEMGMVFKIYAGETKEHRFPHLLASETVVNCDDLESTPRPLNFIEAAPHIPAIYPEYLTDPAVVFCPSDAREKPSMMNNGITGRNEFGYPCEQPRRGMRLAAASYFYLGWMFDRVSAADADGSAGDIEGPKQMVEALGPVLKPWRAGRASGSDVAALDADLESSTKGLGNRNSGEMVRRLSDGLGRFLITDTNNGAAALSAESTVWVMLDLIGNGKALHASPTGIDFNHSPAACNVLFLDGHVEHQVYNKRKSLWDASLPVPTNRGVANFMTSAFDFSLPRGATQ